MLKLLILGAILYFIYISFFKRKIINTTNTTSSKNKKKIDADTVVECHQCKTYVSIDEAIMMDGKYFCSKECVDAYNRS